MVVTPADVEVVTILVHSDPAKSNVLRRIQHHTVFGVADIQVWLLWAWLLFEPKLAVYITERQWRELIKKVWEAEPVMGYANE